MLKSNVQQIMKDKSFTIRALEEKTKLAQMTILRARKDEKIGLCNLRTLIVIARALGVSVHDLFTDQPDPE